MALIGGAMIVWGGLTFLFGFSMKPPIPTRRAAEILDCGPREVRRLARLGRIQGASKLVEDDPNAPWVFDPEDLKVLPPERAPGWPHDPPADV